MGDEIVSGVTMSGGPGIPQSEELGVNSVAPALTLVEYKALIGRELGCSDWFDVSQARIDAFANCTEDWQFIHVDPERARNTPFGGTIAHGYLTLSLLSAMSFDALPSIAGQQMAVNYGFDKLRFMAPVHTGRRA